MLGIIHHFLALPAWMRARQLRCQTTRSQRRSLRHILLFAVLLCSPIETLFANTKTILVITDPASPVVQGLVTQIQLTLSGQDIIWKLSDYRHIDFTALAGGRSANALILTVGTAAARALENATFESDVLQIMVSRSVFDYVRQNVGPDKSKKIHAILLDQPFSRILSFIDKLPLNPKGVSFLLGPSSRNYLPELQKEAEKLGLKFHQSEMVVGDEAKSISALFEKKYPVLSIPDSLASSPSNSKWLLYMAYQERTPVIGFSSAFVGAGAFGAIYTPPELIAKHASELLLEWLKHDSFKLQRPIYPKYFDIQFNEQVASALRISLPEKELLLRELQREEMAK